MKKTIIIHPILFAIFPVLSLYYHNQDLANISYIFSSLAFLIIGAALLFFALNKIIKNSHQTAIITSLFLILFFSFGHFLNLFIPKITFGNYVINNANYFILLTIWLVIFTALCLIILTGRKTYNNLTKYLNAVAFFLVIIPLAGIGYYEFNANTTALTLEVSNHNLTLTEIKNLPDLPDIYYIILDGYGRADVLQKIYNYDNTAFINYLTAKGFFIGRQSSANYPQTYLSIASALNLNYVDKLISINELSDDRGPLRNLLKNNQVYYFLKKIGYKFAALPSTWTGTAGNIHADINIGQKNLGLNEFESMLINTTPLKIIFDKGMHLNNLRERILFAFDHIPDITEIEAPTFTYVHILSPHPPFIFNADGDAITPEGSGSGLDGDHYFKENPGVARYRKKYIDQLIFINKQTMTMIDEIIKKSAKPPLIIIQSDHGPGSTVVWENPEITNMKERMPILNAYYLPPIAQASLYESITPINTFRIIFNSIFKTNLELLEDRNYFATWSQPYKFIDVTEAVIPNGLKTN